MLAKRIASASVLFIFGLILVIAGGWVFTAGITIILAAASWEYTRMFEKGGFSPANLATSGAVAVCAAGAYLLDQNWFAVLFTGSIFIVILFHILTFSKNQQSGGVDLAISLSALAFIAFLGSFLIRVRFLPDGMFWIMVAIAPAGLSDVAGYLIGTRFGRHSLAPALSPGKTTEGYLAGIAAGTLGGVAAAWIAVCFGAHITVLQGFLIGLSVSLSCPIGDLAKSLAKRQFSLKNTGAAIPGHGGILDRIDTWLVAAPVAYFLMQFF